jgi:hypothetical protein
MSLSRLTLFLVAGCSACDDKPSPVDSGVERDAGVDAGRRDAGRRDSGPPRPDAGSDAGPPHPAGFVPLEGLPDGCVIERAEHPEVLFDSTWVECGTGCRRLARDPRYLRGVEPDTGYYDGERFWFFLVQDDISTGAGRMVVLAASDGTVAGAWRGPYLDASRPMCVVDPEAVDEGAATISVRTGFGGLPWRAIFYHGSIDAIGEVSAPTAILDETIVPEGAIAQTLDVSPTTVVAEVQPRGTVVAIEEGEVQVIGGLGTPVAGLPQVTQLVGRTAFWEDWGAQVQLAFGRIGSPPAILRSTLPDTVRRTVVGPDAIVWLETRGPPRGVGEYEAVELWMSPFADEPSSFAPRMVRSMDPFIYDARGGAGMYAQLRMSGSRRIIAILDLADGRRRDYLPEMGGMVQYPPIAMGPTEMAVIVGWGAEDHAVSIVDLTTLPYVAE